MTKEELQAKVDELEQDLAKLKHTATTIQAKDVKITELNNLRITNETEIRKLKISKENLESRVTELSRDNISLKNSLNTSEEEFKAQYQKEKNELVAAYNVLNIKCNERTAQLNRITTQYGSLLKTLQGVTDSHIDWNAFFVQNLKEE